MSHRAGARCSAGGAGVVAKQSPYQVTVTFAKWVTVTFFKQEAQETMWFRSASVTASVRLATPSFDRMLLTCDLIVDGLTVSLPAICVLFSPSIIKDKTSRSRSVRSSPGGGG